MTILYPKAEGSTFDMDYYTGTHMPMLAEALGDHCHGWGAATLDGDKYHAMGWAMVTDHDSLNATLAEHGAKIMGDVPNYTSVQPELLTGLAAGGSE